LATPRTSSAIALKNAFWGALSQSLPRRKFRGLPDFRLAGQSRLRRFSLSGEPFASPLQQERQHSPNYNGDNSALPQWQSKHLATKRKAEKGEQTRERSPEQWFLAHLTN
jgi:hypothetical protein